SAVGLLRPDVLLREHQRVDERRQPARCVDVDPQLGPRDRPQRPQGAGSGARGGRPARRARATGRCVDVTRGRARPAFGQADKGPLTATVEYSADDGRTFTAVSIGPNKNSVALPAALLSSSRRAKVRVRVQDGFHETVVTSPRFVALGAPPQLRISSPAPGT